MFKLIFTLNYPMHSESSILYIDIYNNVSEGLNIVVHRRKYDERERIHVEIVKKILKTKEIILLFAENVLAEITVLDKWHQV